VGLCLGGSLTLSWSGVGIFAYICTASILGYCIWYSIVKDNPLSKLFIIKFTEPLFACVFGAILLSENIFKWQYLLAIGLIAFGILLGNKKKKEE
jgi:drug/metabolite transporter (DMT)-like permease